MRRQKKPWLSIIWFGVWGLFQSYAVFSVIAGTWKRPEAFPEEAYNSLIFPDMLFIPLYLATSILLFRNKPLEKTFGLIAGGAVIYVMIYLLALSGLKGTENLIFDSLFHAYPVDTGWHCGVCSCACHITHGLCRNFSIFSLVRRPAPAIWSVSSGPKGFECPSCGQVGDPWHLQARPCVLGGIRRTCVNRIGKIYS